MAESVLEVKELTKRFGSQTAVDGLSFQLERGEILGLLGANGAGKTTVMSMLLGLTTPNSGDIHVFGLPLKKHRVAILQRCNFSSAYTSLPSNLMVWQNLKVFAMIYGVKNPAKKIDQLLELMEISHLKKKPTGDLSAGEATRVNLCKALLNDPELLLLDEPTASLDPDIADKVRKLVRHLQKERGISILYTSHNMRDIEEVCDRVLFMHKGQIVSQGTPQEMMDQSNMDSLEDVFIHLARNTKQEL